MATVHELANLSNAVYGFNQVEGWTLLHSRVDNAVLQVAVYKNTNTKEIAMVFAGT